MKYLPHGGRHTGEAWMAAGQKKRDIKRENLVGVNMKCHFLGFQFDMCRHMLVYLRNATVIHEVIRLSSF